MWAWLFYLFLYKVMKSVHGRFTLCAPSYYVMRMAILCDVMSISIVRDEKENRRANQALFLKANSTAAEEKGLMKIGSLLK